MNNHMKRGTAEKGKSPRPGYGKDPVQVVNKVSTNKISKQNTQRGSTLEGKNWGKVLKKREAGEGYTSSLKAGIIKLEKPKELPGGAYRKPEGRKHKYKSPKWVPGQNVYPKKSASNMIPAFQGGPGH